MWKSFRMNPVFECSCSTVECCDALEALTFAKCSMEAVSSLVQLDHDSRLPNLDRRIRSDILRSWCTT